MFKCKTCAQTYPPQEIMAMQASAFQRVMSVVKQWWLLSLQEQLVRGRPALMYDRPFTPEYLVVERARDAQFIFGRFERQERGSAHIHMLMWLGA